ncbi:MAG: pentapeptide repeat-containing protein [Methylobacter sp.]|nr:pentapeptide repeat-containing protein [Methylobacter sp.]
MSNPASLPNDESSPHIEKLLEAANSASQTVAALHIAFMAFAAYLGVIVWGTTHEDLLRISPVKLPILDVELPLTAFYSFVPWMVVLLHFNLLMQLELLSCKLWNLDRDLPITSAGQQVRDRLFIFPFTHLIVGRSNVWLIRWLLALIVGITVIALPLFMLLAAQIRFLPFHDEAITWSQRLAVWTDAAMLLALWPLIASPQDRAREWWKNASYRLLGYWPAWLRYFAAIGWNRLTRSIQRRWRNLPRHESVPQSLLESGTEPKGMIVLLTSVPLVVLLSIISVIPGSITVQTYYFPIDKHEKSPRYFEDWLIRHVPEAWLSVAAHQYDVVSCTSLALAEKSEASILQVMLGPCAWFNLGFFPRNLNLREARLVPKEVPLSLLTRAIDPNKSVRDAAFKEFDGLNLQNRDLRFANLFGAVLPKADLRHVQLQGAILLKAKLQGVAGWDKTQLQGAILGGTQLQSAVLIEADLQGADLRGADLQGADLSWAKLQSADLRGANLQGTDLQEAKLQGANLRGAKLLGALLREANLQGADLVYAKLQGADLALADLQGAQLRETKLQGSDWSQANLNGIFIVDSSIADWDERQQRKLETTLKLLLDDEKFSAFQSRMKLAGTGLPTGKVTSQAGCYSDNPALLECEYAHPAQLDAYRTNVLTPKLIDLACSDAAIAAGIARRGSDKSTYSDPDFGLAAALLKALDAPKSCAGLAALPEQTRQKLGKTAEQQKSYAMPNDTQ